MRVLFIDKVHAILLNKMIDFGIECIDATSWSHDQITERISGFEGIVIRSKFNVNVNFLKQAKRLKFIARSGSGLENIDLDFCKKNNIQCFNSPEGNKDAVGEHLIGMLLSLMNNLYLAQSDIKNGIWDREKNRGTELKGKTVGIIGYGNNGQAFAKKLSGFDCKILAYDKYKSSFDNSHAQFSSLEEIKKNAEVLSFHVPYTSETHYYFSNDFLAAMENPFYLLNAARGKVVNTKALISGLENGQIIGACLDVLEYERPSFEDFMSNNPPNEFEYLVQSEKVVLSPHVAGWTIESYQKLSEVLWRKIEDWMIKTNLSSPS